MMKVTEMKRNQHIKGFTLLELLIALTIFAILSALAYGGLNNVLNTQQHVDEMSERLSALQSAFMIITRDLSQMSPRQVLDQHGDPLPPLSRSAAGVDGGLVEFTHAGWRNPANRVRSTLQRVAYELKDEQLMRMSWPVLDRAHDSKPYTGVLLDGVVALEFRFMDEQSEWHEEWPPTTLRPSTPPGAANNNANTYTYYNCCIPIAIEVMIEMDEWGKINRLIEGPDFHPQS
jgi:general secretion pathway protein J